MSAVAELKGGAETVLVEMLRSPFIRPELAVPGLGALASFASGCGIRVHHFDLGSVTAIRRPIGAIDLLRTGADALRVARQLAAIARSCNADIVHTNGMKVHVTGALARLLHGTPTVVHMHDVPYSRAERLIWRGLAKTARHTIAGSDICFAGVSRTGKLSVVMQGVDLAPARHARMLPARPVLGFVGRFHPFKGVHLLLDWFEAVADTFPQLTLLLRGRSDAEGSAYWDALRPKAERLVLSGRCRIEGWRGSDQDVFDGVDILAAPSSTPEVGPRVIMEAMLRGIPAIGYPKGGAVNMIPRLEIGEFASDVTSFRHALSRLLQPDTYASISAAALTHAGAAFRIDRFWQDLYTTYGQVVRGS